MLSQLENKRLKTLQKVAASESLISFKIHFGCPIDLDLTMNETVATRQSMPGINCICRRRSDKKSKKDAGF
jgi:hypothetical protein